MITRFLACDVAVKDLDAAAKKYSDILGVEPLWKGAEHSRGTVREAAFYVNDSKFALLTSVAPDEGDAIARFLKENGEGVYAYYFEVDNIEQTIEELKKKGVEFATEKAMEFDEGWVIRARPSSMFGCRVGFAEPRDDLPWGKRFIPYHYVRVDD